MAFPIRWDKLKNPIIKFPDRPIKDQCVYFEEKSGWFYVFASGGIRLKTKDFLSFEEVKFPEVGGSPDIIKVGYKYYITSQHAKESGSVIAWILNKFRVRDIHISVLESLDDATCPVYTQVFKRWFPARNIDGCLYEPNKWNYPESNAYFMLYKSCQKPRQAVLEILPRASRMRVLSDDIMYVDGEWAENFQIINIDGSLKVIATAHRENLPSGGFTSNNFPFIYIYSPEAISIIHRKELSIPQENWNTVMKANTGHLCDWRKYDGYFYLTYAGSNDSTSFNGRGHGKIGIARSKNLYELEVP